MQELFSLSVLQIQALCPPSSYNTMCILYGRGTYGCTHTLQYCRLYVRFLSCISIKHGIKCSRCQNCTAGMDGVKQCVYTVRKKPKKKPDHTNPLPNNFFFFFSPKEVQVANSVLSAGILCGGLGWLHRVNAEAHTSCYVVSLHMLRPPHTALCAGSQMQR